MRRLVREVEEAIPVNPIRLVDKQLGRSPQPKLLYLFSPEGRYAHLGDPNRKSRYSLDLSEFLGPFMDGPVVPIEGESVNRDHVYRVQYSLCFHVGYEIGING